MNGPNSKNLLQTKLYVPRERPSLVLRTNLIKKLSEGVQQGCKRALISAPAGSGKTTLLTQFVAQIEQPVAWLSLDEADDDPTRFWAYLIAACRTILEGVGESALSLLGSQQPLPADTVPTLLINDIAGLDQVLILILDDYHAIQTPAIQEGVSFLLEHLPDNLHIIISSRIDPPWPLSRYRVRYQLTEIRVRDLRFSLDETQEFLHQTVNLNLSSEDIAALEARTEGWVAGLQLAAIAMQSPLQDLDTAAFVQAFTGSHLYVAEYLVEEILQRQPEPVQNFLLNTSILERLNAGLCDAVTGCEDGQATLAALYRDNLFVIPMDAEGRWFRYHHLFADLLRARLPQVLSTDEVGELHLKAATWYEENGLVQDAIKHALAAKDFERVASLVEQEARTLISSGQVRTLNRWLSALPETSFQAHPRLHIYRLWIELMQEKLDISVPALREKEALLRTLPPSPENEQLQVELMAVLCRFVAFAGDTAWAIQLAEEALSRLPDGETMLRARAYSALTASHWIEGDVDKANQAYDRCLSLALEDGNYNLAAHTSMMMAISQIDYGQLYAAARTSQAIIDMGEKAGQKVFFLAGQGYIGLAEVHLEWYDLETAVTYLEQGMTLCRQGGLAGLSAGHAIKARLLQAQGEYQAAAAELELLGETGVDPTGTVRKILLRIAMDDLGEAVRLAQPWLNAVTDNAAAIRPPLLVLEIIQITLARLFLAQGKLDQAAQLLAQAQETAVVGNRVGRLIEIYLIQALIIQERNQGHANPEARQLLQRALELAAPENYMLLFLEEETAVTPLLQAVVNHRESPIPLKEYARKILSARRQSGKPDANLPSGESIGLVEELTPREMEVLQLVATGDSNQEIADKLFITVRTVKKHVTNILGKLTVNNRTQAVARAHELGLIASDLGDGSGG
jgi:LuxR family maltose regulon positive regulatory protein